MLKRWHHPNLGYLGISGAVIVLDQLTKFWVVSTLKLGKAHAIIPFLNITLAQNQGSAFGFLNQWGTSASALFALLALLISIFLLVWLYRLREQPWLATSIALILGGALGNFIDRIVYGYVIDFIDVYVGRWHWPAFNVADSCIVIGAILLLVLPLKRAKKG